MRFWLMKSEPETFAIEDLRRKKVSGWDGVRNYAARNFLREMKLGDQALFYHSSTKAPAIVGVMEVVREAYPDPSQFDRRSEYYDRGSTRDAPRWFQVDVRFVRAFPRPLTLEAIKQAPALREMVLLKRGRLSVQPVRSSEWAYILKSCL
ncbi:MAG: EVE domain-containing protein [Armatimonadota bacterium]